MLTLSDIRPYLQNAKLKNSEIVAACPVCESNALHGHHLYIKNQDNPLVMYCHHNCAYKDIINTFKALGAQGHENPEDNIKKRKIIKKTEYNYRNTDGSTAYTKLRIDYNSAKKGKTKEYRFFYTDADGKKVYKKPLGCNTLYNLDGLAKATPSTTLYIVEGEKCADAMTAHQLLATTSNGGASSLKLTSTDEALIKKFGQVIVIPDNDAAGYTYLKKWAKYTNQYIDLKDIWPDCQEKDDVFDYFNAGGTVKTLQSAKVKEILQDIQQREYTNFTGQPLRLLLPTGYTADDTCILKTSAKDTGKGTPVTRVPMMPTKILKNVEDKTEKIELSWRDRGWHSITAGREIIVNSRKILDLAAYGVPIDSEISASVVSYLAKMLIVNTDLPVVKTVDHMGWSGASFIPYSKDLLFDSAQCQEIYEAIHTPQGSLQKWVNVVVKLRQNMSIRLLTDAALASVLIEPLGLLPSIIHIWGQSGTGKTVALRVAASIYGNPSVLVKTLNSTVNSIMTTATVLRNLPFFADELQAIKDKCNGKYDPLIMQLTEGINRGRLTKDGRIAKNKNWHNIFVFSGEEPCVNDNSNAGAQNRVIEIECDQQMIEKGREVNYFVSRNYGYAGEYFLKKLQGIDLKHIMSYFVVWQKMIDSNSKTTAKQRDSLAVICTADRLFEDIFEIDEERLDTERNSKSNPLFVLKTNDQVDIAQRAYNYLLDLIVEKGSCFQRIEETEADTDLFRGGNPKDYKELWGKINKKTMTVSFLKTVIVAELKNAGFNFESVKKSWKTSGILLAPNDRYTKNDRILGDVRNCVVLKIR